MNTAEQETHYNKKEKGKLGIVRIFFIQRSLVRIQKKKPTPQRKLYQKGIVTRTFKKIENFLYKRHST